MLGNKKESQKEEKPAGQVTKKCPPPPISLAQGLDSLLDIVYTKLVS